MAWFILICAGLFETGWAIGLKASHGFTRLWPSVWTVGAMAVSLVLLGVAMRTLPVGTPKVLVSTVASGTTGSGGFGGLGCLQRADGGCDPQSGDRCDEEAATNRHGRPLRTSCGRGGRLRRYGSLRGGGKGISATDTIGLGRTASEGATAASSAAAAPGAAAAQRAKPLRPEQHWLAL